MKKQTEKKVKALDIMRTIILISKGSGEIMPDDAIPFVVVLQRLLNLETPMQAALLAAFVNMLDDERIEVSDIASFYNVQPIEVVAELSALDYFVSKGIIVHEEQDEYGYYYLSKSAIPALQDNRLPEITEQPMAVQTPVEKKKKVYNNVICHQEIEEKRLIFSDSVEADVERLRTLLQKENMDNILRNLTEHKMRRCFTCVFYGEPGTGKTETVRQLARMSQRDIFQVDIPSIRNKWIGDTEKNIKALFDNYREAVRNNEIAPILLFNEADALLTKRSTSSTASAEKMENAMQDIILQEMETLEGIMIATTNITAALDDAFERRFLYKIRFEQPSAEARKEIWLSMLPELTEEFAAELAKKHNLSGGEIENIARKYIIDNIISNNKENLPLLRQFCQKEKIQSKNIMQRMGFNMGLEEGL